MANAPLSPSLLQVAEQYLGRALQPQEAQQLATFQQSLMSQPAPPLNAVQQAKQQVQQTIAQGQNRASSSVRDILASIQASSSQALQVQEAEEQAILKLLEGTQSLAELRPSTLQPAMATLQPGSQLALSQIAEHLSNLARQEVENCFQQYFGPLSAQLQEMVMKLQAMDPSALAVSSQTVPAPQAAAATPQAPSAAPSAQAVAFPPQPDASAAAPVGTPVAPAAGDIHSPLPPPSMQ